MTEKENLIATALADQHEAPRSEPGHYYFTILFDVASGTAPQAQAAEVTAHAASCPECFRKIEGIRRSLARG